jgi:hypothetical protein
MSDLQARIARVLKDFAINELGLRQENVGLIHRWVTNWKDT